MDLEASGLLEAVSDSDENKIRALVNAGTDVNMIGYDGQTALFCAVQQSNNENIIRALVDAGADVNMTDYDGQTALFCAFQQSKNENIIRALVDAGADVNTTDSHNRNALLHAVQQSNNESVVRALIDAGADVNITDNIGGQTALFYAVQQSNNESVVRVLIDAGADVNITDHRNQTALFYAVQQSNNESVVRALIDAGGALVNARDVYGRTPLFYALAYPKSARILVEKLASYPFRLKDNSNCSILSFSVDKHLFPGDMIYRHPVTTIPGIFHGFSENSLSRNIPSDVFDFLNECEVQKVTFAEAILNIAFCKFPLMFPESQGFRSGSNMQVHIIRALELASQFIDNAKEKVEMLIALISEKCTNNGGVSEALRLLVELGVDPNSADSDGNTALHYATGLALKGVPQEIVMKICLQLENLGVQFNSRNCKNETPLLYCLSRDVEQLREKQSSAVKTLVEVCRFMTKHGSSIEERSRSGKTVFHLILEFFQEILRLPPYSKAVRYDVLHEAMPLLELFPPEKVANMGGIVNVPDANLDSPLHLWASLELQSPQDYTSNVTRDLTFMGFLQTVFNYLRECGAKLNARNGNDQTPLHLCSTWIAVNLLLDAKANANDVDSSRASPLIAAAKRSRSEKHGGLYQDASELKDPKLFWKTAIDEGLDPWTKDEKDESVLSILIEDENFVLAKALVDVACERNYTQSETFAVGLLTAICKDKSTRTNWKSNLVQDVLKSRPKGRPTSASEPLRLCCKNIIETGVSKAKVHCEIIKILRVYGADCKSCLDMADTCDALKELFAKPLDFGTVPTLIPWTSISKTHEVKLAKVARRQECDVIHEEFWYHKEHVGSGSYGDVFVGINEKDGREVAIKRIVKLRMQRPEDKREITNLTTLADCEQIVRYLHFYEDEKFSYIVLELMEGNLDEYLTDGSTFDAKNGTQLCQDVVKGLKFLHEQNIIHRDLKPGNILYKTHPHLRLKLADFGLSRRIDSTATTVYGTTAGTRCWMAPEVLKGTHDHSKTSDMFCCGLVLHYILSVRKHPFSPRDCASKGEYQIANETEANIMKGNLEGWDRSIQLEATHLVEEMLEYDEDKRPFAVECLDHPLFWSNEKKIDVLVAVGNQTVFEYPRAGRLICLSAVEVDFEKNFGTIVVHGEWNDPRYKDMPHIYAEMTSRRRYDTHSVVELVRLIRNAYAHISEATRPTAIRKMLLEDFVFLKYFPHLVMEVYKVVTDHGWDQTVEEIKYAMNK